MSEPNIVLVGFMGTGKTSAGKIVADRLGRRHVDTDDLIEEKAGCTISTLFAEQGEVAFRELEKAVVREVAEEQDRVVTAGGGVVVNPENMDHFQRTGVVICLQADVDTILGRVSGEYHRPLLQGANRRARVEDLLAQRKPLYDAIPHQVDTAGRTLDEVVERVLVIYADACKG